MNVIVPCFPATSSSICNFRLKIRPFVAIWIILIVNISEVELLHRIKSERCKSSQDSNSNSPVNVLDMLLWKICFNWQSNTGYTPTNTHPRQHFFVPWLRSPPIFFTDQRSPPCCSCLRVSQLWKKKKKNPNMGVDGQLWQNCWDQLN